jgi:hypothetical protein
VKGLFGFFQVLFFLFGAGALVMTRLGSRTIITE